MTKIDDLDREIVRILQEDAQYTNTSLAAMVGVSEATVRRRIQKLIDENVFRIRAVSDPFKLGYTVIVIIGVWVEKRVSTSSRGISMFTARCTLCWSDHGIL